MTGRQVVFWVVVAATGVVYAVMLLWTLPNVASQAGGMTPFDLRPSGYGVQDVTAFRDAISDDGLALYLGPQRWLDTAFPILVAIGLWAAMWQIFSLPIVRALLGLAIVGGMLADLVENALVADLLTGPGGVTASAVEAASRMTVAKFGMTIAAMLIVAAGAIRKYLFNRTAA